MRKLLLGACLAAFAVGCVSKNEHPSPAAHAVAHWSYEDQALWPGACAAGRAQSPIALPAVASEDLPDLAPHYAPAQGRLVNNGHTLQFTPVSGSTLSIGRETFALVQFHAHTPSEHTLHGAPFPAEIHFVHRSQGGALVVVGVFVQQGRENPALARLLGDAPTEPGEEHAVTLAFDPAPLWPGERAYYAYAGSLTTPPCSEGVRWRVLAVPIEASSAQLTALRETIGVTNRDIQSLNERDVRYGS